MTEIDTDTNEAQSDQQHESSENVCERCGDEYEEYIYAVRDNFSDIVQDLRSEYDNLCKPCRVAEHPEQAFAGADEIQPTEDVQ